MDVPATPRSRAGASKNRAGVANELDEEGDGVWRGGGGMPCSDNPGAVVVPMRLIGTSVPCYACAIALIKPDWLSVTSARGSSRQGRSC